MSKRPSTYVASNADRGSRWQVFRDVLVFQLKCGMEAVLDLTLIPVSLGAAGLDVVLGHWRKPHLFHAVLRFGERCETWIDLWGVAANDTPDVPRGANAVMHDLEAVIRNPRTGPDAVRTLRHWAAMKLVGDDSAGPRLPGGDGNDGSGAKP